MAKKIKTVEPESLDITQDKTDKLKEIFPEAFTEGKVVICLEEKIMPGLVEKIMQEQPEKVICLDRGFEGDDQLKTNTALQMEQEKVEFRVI